MANRLTKLFKELAELPVYTSAYFLKSDPGSYNLRINTSVRDFLRKTKRTISKTIVTTSPDAVVTSSIYDSTDALASVPSHSGKRLAVLRETFDGTTKKRYVEVWRGNKLEAVKDVTKVHADFHIQPTLFSLSFSRSETSLIYTAEANAPEVDGNSEDKNTKYRYLPDFGERMSGKKRPTLFLFRWTPEQYVDEDTIPGTTEAKIGDPEPTVVALKPDLPKSSTFVFGGAVFAPNDKEIFTTGYEQTLDGRRLGPFGCWNRPSAIFKIELPKDIPNDADGVTVTTKRLTPPTVAARSPRVSPIDRENSYTVVWLSNPIGGAHISCASLWILQQNESKLLVNSVYEPKDLETFPGLYVEQLPPNPFISSDNSGIPSHLITHSMWGPYQKLLKISLDTGGIETLAGGPRFTWTILNTDGRRSIIVKKSSMTSPEELLLGHLPQLEWQSLDRPIISISARKELDALRSEIVHIPDRHPTQVITLRREGKEKLPMVSIPHGGPHSSFPPEFSATPVCFASEGCNLVNLINYTGSTGYGQKYIDRLLGVAGTLDVQDCYNAIQHLIRLGYSEAGRGKQFVQGGSHGGFLAAHLIGQYPLFFSAAVMRNPVISVGEMLSVSDIPDWTYWEFGLPFGPTSTLTTQTFDTLQKASPISYVDAVSTPVLLQIGEIDRRVPPTQGINYYYSLKGRGKEVEMDVYPGNGHSLDLVEAELAVFESTREWFVRFLK